MRRTQPEELDDLIAEITIDCNGDDESLMGFEVAFEDQVSFPIPGTVVGEDVQVVSAGRSDGRRELVATCERGGRRTQVALLDVELKDAEALRLVAAYRRWLGP